MHGISCLVCVFVGWVGWFFACLAGVPCSWLVGFLWVRMTLYSSFFMTFGIHSVFVLIGDVDSDYFPRKLTFFTWKWGGSLEMEMFSPFSGFLAVALDFREGTTVTIPTYIDSSIWLKLLPGSSPDAAPREHWESSPLPVAHPGTMESIIWSPGKTSCFPRGIRITKNP